MPPRSSSCCAGTFRRACSILALLISGVAGDVDPGDRAALLDLYHATGGPGWSDSSNWDTPADVCSWYGVACTGDGSRVMQLCVAIVLPSSARATAAADAHCPPPHGAQSQWRCVECIDCRGMRAQILVLESAFWHHPHVNGEPDCAD